MLPSFFFTNNIDALHGEMLSLINPFSNNSSSYLFNSFNSNGVIWYGAINIGVVPSIVSILKSTSLYSGNPGNSSKNTYKVL